MTPNEIHNATRQWLALSIEQISAADSKSVHKAEFAKDHAAEYGMCPKVLAREMLAEEAELSMTQWRQLHRKGDYEQALHAAKALAKDLGLPLAEGTAEFDVLCERLTLAAAELHATRMARLVGDYAYNPLNSAANFAELPVTPPEKACPSLQAAVKAYIAESDSLAGRSGGMIYQTQKKRDRALQLFMDWLGPKVSLGSISKTTLGDFRSLLIKLPSRFSKEDATMSLSEIAASAEKRKAPRLAANTINGYLGGVSGLLEWCESKGYIESNPAKSVRVKEKDGKRYAPFHEDHLKKIFSAPLFTTCHSEREDRKPGTSKVRNWKYWLPLIGLFTGARIEEICQLQTEDVQEVDGIWCFNIREGAERSLKTAAAARLVPIHPDLKALGFLEFVESRRKAGAKRLLPGIDSRIKGKWSHYPSRWFGKFLGDVIGPERGARHLVFHSFRHLMKDAMRDAEISDTIQDKLMGHEGGRTGDGYGKGYRAVPLYNAMAKIKLPVDLSHLDRWSE